MTSTGGAEVLDLGLARLVHLEASIGESEQTGLRARWEFGHELVAKRDGKGRLPNGYLTKVCEQTGASRSEVKYRAQFAERFPTEDELANAVGQFGSWHQVVKVALPREQAEVNVADVESQPLPEGLHRVIVADPPWQYGNTSTRGAAEDHYGTMTIAELCELPVEERTADEAHLYLWTTNGFLREAFELVDAWGFTYKTCLTWVKPQMGMGNYFRSSTEHVLFGARGGLRTRERNIVNWFEAKRGKHSAKPETFYELVQKASPGPYMEMFARCRRDSQLFCRCSRCRLGWTVWGNET